MDALYSLISFPLYIALVTVCMMRRKKSDFPLTAVIGAWILAITSTLSLAPIVIGEARFHQFLQHILPDSWVEESYGFSLINYNSFVGLVALIGMLTLAFGIFKLARQRTREAIEVQQSYSRTP